MESLALVVTILFLIAIFAGPIAIFLSSQRMQRFTDSKRSPVFIALSILRKSLHLLLIVAGAVVGIQFGLLADLPLPPKFIGLASVITCYIALRREYFPDLFIVRNVLNRTGISGKRGGSSGNDGHGPQGQH